MNGCAAVVKPFVGVLCIDRAKEMSRGISSYIDNEYVEYLEAAGAEVVPIWIDKSLDYYEDILSKVNGVLLPGGAVFVNENDPARLELTNHCVTAARIIIEIAKKKHNEGIHLPVWGTCLGFQLLIMYTTDMANTAYGRDPREKCQYMNCYLPVEFLPDFRESRLLAKLSAELQRKMKIEPFGNHRHMYCVSIEFCKTINDDWHVLAKNKDGHGLEFASIMEHRRYYFFGTQFHPESHCSPQCQPVKDYLSNFFVNQCRLCKNRFGNIDDAKRHLIRNFPITSEGKRHARVFSELTDYPPE
ncbi:gamma-glutamyl hydrolase [Ceratitis capitata]|uniref:gamma-glutamyl hydrolase n=1 Tax=Ceratitis capitata TaxID=7213 RepID=UPI000329EF2F|nr:gamma-glutamyl hydrolase [Ceratitis capitata]XP_012157380.1 gamma-glutamyl hydrolase [Ceratitis capitata]XP_020714597.1 gamma-glutamyl hydrolase [Ceratitis capitata]